MNLLLIGHSIIDHYKVKNVTTTKPGGIYYSTMGLLSNKKKSDKFYLLTGISKKNVDLFERMYGSVNKKYIIDLEDMPEVFLEIHENKERGEIYQNISSSLPVELINDWSYFDGILINMITGFDITIDQLSRIRASFSGLIYLDIHTMSRGIDENMKREFRHIPNVDDWLSSIDILQCNENELRTIYDSADEKRIAEKILELGPKILLVTKGNKGVSGYLREESGIRKTNILGEKVKVVNKIGCGDIFGAFFFYSYLCGKNMNEALSLANKTAGISVSNDIINHPELLKDYV